MVYAWNRTSDLLPRTCSEKIEKTAYAWSRTQGIETNVLTIAPTFHKISLFCRYFSVTLNRLKQKWTKKYIRRNTFRTTLSKKKNDSQKRDQ